MTTKYIHITKPSWNKIRATSKGTMCGRLAGLLSRTTDIAEATCPRCVAEALSREAAPVKGA